MMLWLCVALSAVSLVLGVVALLVAHRPTAPILLAGNGLVLLLASLAFGIGRAPIPSLLQLLHRPTAAVIFGAFALAAILAIRLLDSYHFHGHVEDLDFGTACHVGVCRRNMAFNSTLFSLGRFFQGMLSVCLFSAFERLLQNLRLVAFARIACLGLAVYPTYELSMALALDLKHFATSSFSSNATEWVFGFLTGLSLGILSMAIRPADTMPVFPPNPVPWAVGWGRFFVSFVLFAVAISASILLGLTWDNLQPSNAKIVLGMETLKDALPLICALVAFPVLVLVGLLAFLRHEDVDEDSEEEEDIVENGFH